MRLTYRNEKGNAYVQLYSELNKATGTVAERAKKERAVRKFFHKIRAVQPILA